MKSTQQNKLLNKWKHLKNFAEKPKKNRNTST